MSVAGRFGGAVGEQFYVTHCATADSVLNNPGYTVRASSSNDPNALDAAFKYPPYELPIDMWRHLPSATAAPRRLARTAHPNGNVWVAHSAYLAKDTVDRDRSYFSHLLLLNTADPAAVLRSWGADEWMKNYPKGATKKIGRRALPVGTLVSDDGLTAFLKDKPTGPTELSLAVCPSRLRVNTNERRDLFARVLQAVLAGARSSPAPRRVYIHAEPGLVALLLYGAVRLLPKIATNNLTFSTFEPAHRNLRDYKLAEVVGTYLGAPGKGLEEDLGTTRGLVLDTFSPERSSLELRAPLAESLPEGLSELIDLAATGQWALMGEVYSPDDKGNVLSQIEEASFHARAFGVSDAGNRNLEPSVPADPKRPAGAGRKPAKQQLPPGLEHTSTPAAFADWAPTERGSYSAQISRTNPACLLFLIDQSRSMEEPFVGGGGQSKAANVADAVNRLLQNVILRSAKADGVRDYFRIGVIGYGKGIKAGFGGSVPFNVLIPASHLAEHPLRIETRKRLTLDGTGGLVEQTVKFPVWFDAEANGQTPMCEALAAAGLAVKGFVEEFPDAYPPIILNLTDGMPSDGNPQDSARALRQVTTSDGAVLLFNLLISSKPVPADYFPATEDGLADKFSKLLFRMSSLLPPRLWEAARAEGHDLKPRARGVVINADPTAVVRFLEIGTRVTPAGK